MLPLQDATVTLVALAAAAILVRRVIGFVRPTGAVMNPGCASCPSRPKGCGTTETLAPSEAIQPVGVNQTMLVADAGGA